MQSSVDGGAEVRCESEKECLPYEEEGQAGHELTAEEETAPKKTLPTPTLPTAVEVEEHSIDHFPYRSWCDECVEGRGRELPHSSHANGERDIAVVSFDYMFLTKKGVVDGCDWDKVAEEDKIDHVKVLVIRDAMSKSVFAHAVPQKGLDPERYVVDNIVQCIEWLGHVKVILKSDNEPAIVQVIKESLRSIRVDGQVAQAGEEHSVPYDPQTNGSAETGVRLVKGHVRTLKMGLERRLKRRIPPNHPILTWLVRHAADLLTYRVRGEDGKTPYQRVRGATFGCQID